MSCCNSKSVDKNRAREINELSCPKCQNKGTKAKVITVQSLLKNDFKRDVCPKFFYRLCKNPKCKVVYYYNEGHFFIEGQLTVKTTLKDRGMDVNICYCFGHTRQSILDELRTVGKSTALEDIKSKMKDPGCFCETSNPQGNCCLGNVTAWIKEAKEILVD